MRDAQDVVALFDAVVMVMSFFYIFVSSFRLTPSHRLIHYLLSFICGTSAVCHFMMYDGFLMLKAGADGHVVRGAMYLAWGVCTPIQLLVLGIIGRLPDASLIALGFLDVLMNLCGFLGDCTTGPSRWIYFGMGVVLFLPQWIFLYEDFDYQLVVDYFGETVAQRYFPIGRFLLLSRVVFPIIWVLEATGTVGPFWSLVSYSATTILSKIGLCFWVMACFRGTSFLKTMQSPEEQNALSAVYASKDTSPQRLRDRMP